MLYRLELTYYEILDVLDVKYIAVSTSGYTIPPGFYTIIDSNLRTKSSLTNKEKVKFTVDDMRRRSNLTTNFFSIQYKGLFNPIEEF